MRSNDPFQTTSKEKLQNIPFFVCAQARARIEQLAREANQEIVTAIHRQMSKLTILI
ncbi:PCP reductase family protein [Nostoc sp.]|uniref:PCP reductase family protein n=1 Tax=Nostoc sp. TaxID=1180 RepID=UPI002FF5AA3B